MPVFEITSPDGTKYRVTGPPGSTREQALAQVQQQQMPASAPPPPFDPTSARTDEFAQREAESSALNRFTKGIAAPVIQTYLGAKDLFTDLSEEEQYALQATERERGTAGALGEVAGETAMLAVPASKAYQGARVLTRSVAPGSRLAAVSVPLTAESALVGGVEAVKAPTGEQDRLEAGTEAALWNLGTGAALSGLTRAYQRLRRPQSFRKSRAAMREQARLRSRGMDDFLPLTEALDEEAAGSLARMSKAAQDKILSNLPVTRTAIDRQKTESLNRWWDTVIQDTLPPNAALRTAQGPQPIKGLTQRQGVGAPAWDAMADVQKFYHKQEYPRLLDKHRFSQRNVTQQLQALASTGKAKKTRNQIAALVEEASENGLIKGGDLKTSIQTPLKAMARTARTQKKPNIPRAREYEQMAELIESGLMARIRQAGPDDIRDYEALKEPYAKYLVVNDTLGRKPQAGETPKPLDLARRAMNKQGQARSVAGRGEAPLQREAARSAEIRKDLPKADDIFRIGAAWGMAGAPLIGGATAGLGGAAASAAIPAHLYGLSRKGYQRYLMSELPGQRRAAQRWRRNRLMAEAIRQATGVRPQTAGRVGISTALDEED